MIDWLGIGHLFELSRTEATLGFFTPLAIFAVFFLAQLILPGRWVPGYVINPETGAPRKYRLNGILIFVVALVVWAFELTGMPRDWCYRSSIYAVAGGTVFTTTFTFLGVFSQPPGKVCSCDARPTPLHLESRRPGVVLRRPPLHSLPPRTLRSRPSSNTHHLSGKHPPRPRFMKPYSLRFDLVRHRPLPLRVATPQHKPTILAIPVSFVGRFRTTICVRYRPI